MYRLAFFALLLPAAGYATTLLDHAYASCLLSPECMETFELTKFRRPQERRNYDLVFEYLLSQETGLDFSLPENNRTLTVGLYWGICETAEKLEVECKHKVSRAEMDHMLTEMDGKRKCSGIKDWFNPWS
jgi:hypothetical protein